MGDLFLVALAGGLMQLEEACCGRHPHHAPELSHGHVYEVGNPLKRHTAAQWNAGEHLKLAKPLDTG